MRLAADWQNCVKSPDSETGRVAACRSIRCRPAPESATACLTSWSMICHRLFRFGMVVTVWAANGKPNVLVILADELGWGELITHHPCREECVGRINTIANIQESFEVWIKLLELNRWRIMLSPVRPG